MATPGSSIRGLLKTLRASLSKKKFDEVQQMLMDREIETRIEVKDLKRDVESMKAEVCKHETSHSLAELDKLIIDEKLEKTQKTCLELQEKVTSLSEELKVSCDREKMEEKRAEERHNEKVESLSEELKASCDREKRAEERYNEKVESLSKELKASCDREKRAEERHNEKVESLSKELKASCDREKRAEERHNEKVESLSEELKASCDREKRAEERHNEKVESLSEELKASCDREKRAEERYNEKVESLSKELKASRDREKRAEERYNNIITKKVQLIVELNGKINELQSKNSEINEQLARRKQTEVDNEVEAKLKHKNTEATLEERVDSQLVNANLEELASFAVFTDKFDANGEKVDFPDMIKCWRHGSENADPQNAAIVPRVVCATSSLEMEGGSSAQDNEASNPPRPAAPPENSAAAKICGAKRKRVTEDARSQYKCEMCGVVCKNITSYITHLSSKKHASMIKKKRALGIA